MRRTILIGAGFLLGFGLAAAGVASAEGICVIFTETTAVSLRATSLTVAGTPATTVPSTVVTLRQSPTRDGELRDYSSLSVGDSYVDLSEQP